LSTYIKLSAALCTLLLAAGCQTTGSSTLDPNEPLPPKNPAFASEMDKFNKQFPNAKATAYETASLAFNNANKLDEKGNCHDMSRHPVTIMLILDAEGRVTSTSTDVDNKKAACFRKAYADVKFPRPPVAPYRKPIILR
jgi:hypothetical protein